MSTRAKASGVLDQPVAYQIRRKGRLSAQRSTLFAGLTVTLAENGDTRLTGPVVDQAALFGLLRKVCDLGMPLLSGVCIEAESSNKETKMSTNQKTPQNGLEAVRVNVKLAALWTSMMFFYIYVDHFGLYKPGYIENILAGKVFVFDITQVFLLTGLVLTTIPSLMIFLSIALPAKVNRWTNISVAAAWIPYTLFNLAGEFWMHMVYGAVVEVILLLLIIRYAWKWTEQEAS